MDGTRFDALLRRAVESRRSLLGGALLAASGLVSRTDSGSSAKHKKPRKCSVCKKRKKGKCKSNPARNGVICATDKVCRNGSCIGFDATCAADASSCGATNVSCGPDVSDCSCYQRVSDGGVACGFTGSFTACSDPGCANDGDCGPDQACIVSETLKCQGCPVGSVCVNLCQGPA